MTPDPDPNPNPNPNHNPNGLLRLFGHYKTIW